MKFFLTIYFIFSFSAFSQSSISQDLECKEQTAKDTITEVVTELQRLPNSSIEQELRNKGFMIPICFKDAYKKLNLTDIEILVAQPEVFLQMIDCNQPGFLLQVSIHESIHLLDLGVSLADIAKQDIHKKFPNFSLRFSKDDRASLPFIDLPSPKNLILKRLQNSFPQALVNESSLFNGFVKDYTLDDTTLSSVSFIYGLATELNAYTHGLSFETRTDLEKKSLPQRVGVLFFLGQYKAYLQQLKKDAPA